MTTPYYQPYNPAAYGQPAYVPAAQPGQYYPQPMGQYPGYAPQPAAGYGMPMQQGLGIKPASPVPTATLTDEIRDRMDDPLEQYATADEREMNENVADLFAALRTLEYLEKAYANARLTYFEYNKQCISLIQQVTHMVAVTHSTLPAMVQVYSKMGTKLERAEARMKAGRPAELPSGASSFTKQATDITAIVLTIKDQLSLDYKTVSDLNPKVRNLDAMLASCAQYLPKGFRFTGTVHKWVERLNGWGPSYSLSADEITELNFDLDNGITEFQSAL